MSNNNADSDIVESNPYAPPAHVEPTGSGNDLPTLLADPVPFTGSLSVENVRDYLRHYDHVDVRSMLLILLLATPFAIIPHLFLGWEGLPISIGYLGIALIAAITSTLPYRLAVFNRANPDCYKPCAGTIDAQGVSLTRDGVAQSFRWDWFDDAIIGEQAIAFRPSLHNHEPLLVAASMLSSLSDWDRVKEVAEMLHDPNTDFGTTNYRKYDVRGLLRRKRDPSVDGPDSAITFRGSITRADLPRRAHSRWRNRPRRAKLVLVGLAFFGASIALGIAQPLGNTFVAVTVTLFLSLGLYRAARNHWSGGASQHSVLYVVAFATDKGITADYAVTTTFVPWMQIRCIENSDDRISLQRSGVRQLIIAKPQMFASSDHWQQFQKLVDEQTVTSE